MPTASSYGGADWFRRLSAYCWKFRAELLVGSAFSVAGSAVVALMPLIVRQIVDGVIVSGRSRLAPWLVLLVAAALFRLCCAFARGMCGWRVRYGVEYLLRTQLFAALLRLDGPQQDRLRTGQVVSRAIADIAAVSSVLRSELLLVASGVLCVGSGVVMMALSWPLGLVAAGVAAAVFAAARRSGTAMSPAYRAYSQQSGDVAGVVEAAVSGVRVVKGFGQESREQARFEAAASRLFRAGLYRVRRASFYYPMLNTVPALGQVAVLAFGGWLTLSGRMSLGTFLAFLLYLAYLVAPVRWFVGQLPDLQSAKVGMQRLIEVIDAEPAIVDAADAVPAPAGAAPVEFRDVTFGYDPDHPVLHGLSLRIEAGQTLALVGGTGSGKSTLALLLARFYDPQRGSVRYAGRDVRGLTLESLRGRLGMVFEENFLFSDTIAANIAFGRPDATADQVRAAARAAEVAEFVEGLPDGYDTVIGERGLTLSGGQRQRVALARALLADPQVLVLDDATSAVDAGVEAEIHATLRKVMAGRTTLLIAHRRSSLHLADTIAVLDRGRLVDTGTHEQLTARCAVYRRLLSGHDEAFDGPAGALGSPPAVDGQASWWASRPPAEDGGVLGAAGTGEREAGTVLARLSDGPDPNLADVRGDEGGFGLTQLVRPVRAGLAALAVLMAASAGAQLVFPWLTRTALDRGVTRGDLGVLLVAAGLALAVTVAAWALRTGQQRISGRIGEQLRLQLGVRCYAHLQRLGLDYYERTRGGQIMTGMTSDVAAVAGFVQGSLGAIAVAAATFGGVLAVMLTLQATLTAAVLTLVPVFAAAALVYRHWSAKAYALARDRLAEVNTSFQENLAGLRTTQAFGRQGQNAATYNLLVERYCSARIRADMYLGGFAVFGEFVNDLATVVVLGVGAAGLGGPVSVGVLTAFLLYITLFFGPVQQLSFIVDSYQRSQVGLRRIRDLLATPTTTPPAATPLPADRVTGSISLDAICFTYPGSGVRALRGITAEIRPGETVAVVGATGAGKSTLLKLLARFYDPTTGTVRIDGTDLRRLDLRDYRHRLGVVPQEPYLFTGSIADAIAYGRPHATPEQIEAAARSVGAHDMITTLRYAYHHPLTERGGNLSAGQRQLIALARAQLVDPDLLLLDEATASLDLATEAAVTIAMQRLAQPRTTLLIAHRLTTAQQADRILVLHRGALAESGTHHQLLHAGGRYAQLWAAYQPQP